MFVLCFCFWVRNVHNVVACFCLLLEVRSIVLALCVFACVISGWICCALWLRFDETVFCSGFGVTYMVCML